MQQSRNMTFKINSRIPRKSNLRGCTRILFSDPHRRRGAALKCIACRFSYQDILEPGIKYRGSLFCSNARIAAERNQVNIHATLLAYCGRPAPSRE
jgi:hypothetical protein